MRKSFLAMLKEVTFSVHHNPHCPMPYQVRLIRPGNFRLDNVPDRGKTKDILGHGPTLEDGAKDAWTKKEMILADLKEAREKQFPRPERLTSLRGL